MKIWKRTPAAGGLDFSKDEWTMTGEIDIKTPAWKVSWSQIGNLLAVSGGDNQVIVLKEAPNGDWETVSKVNDDGVLEEL